MNYQVLYYLLLFALLSIAFIIFMNIRTNTKEQVRIKKNRYSQFEDFIKKRLEYKKIEALFNQSGFKINVAQYQIIRYSLIIVWLLIITINSIMKGGVYETGQIVFLVVLAVVSSPRVKLFNKKAPFKLLLDFFISGHQYRKNLEVYRAISQLKNLAIAKQESPTGSLFILEQLRKFSNITRPVFNRFIALWTLGRKDEACDYFAQDIGTKVASDFASIMSKLDSLSPSELQKQLELLTESIQRERETAKIKKTEAQGNFIYLIVAITSVTVMINFIVVVYLIELFQSFNTFN